MYESSGEPLDIDGPDPRARSLRWYFGHLQSGWCDVTEEEFRRFYRSDDPVAPAQRIRFVKALAANAPAVEALEAFATSAHEAVLRLRDEKGRPWRVAPDAASRGYFIDGMLF